MKFASRTAAAALFGLGLGLGLASSGSAAIVHIESVSGDFSNSGAAPTSVIFVPGGNQIFGSSGNGPGGVDRDYFTFNVLPGHALTGISVLPGTTAIGGGTLSFIAIAAGSQVTTLPTSMSAVGLLGWTHYGPGDIGTGILDDMNTTVAGASGFTAPLGAGAYSIWIQETAMGSASYGFEFSIEAIPEPATWATMIIGFGLAGGAMRARTRVRYETA